MAAGLELGFQAGGQWAAWLRNFSGTRRCKTLNATPGLLGIMYRPGPQAWCVAGVLYYDGVVVSLDFLKGPYIQVFVV